MVAITGVSGNGVAVIDLTSIPEPSTSIPGAADRSPAYERRTLERHSPSAYHDARSRGIRSIPHLTQNQRSGNLVLGQ